MPPKRAIGLAKAKKAKLAEDDREAKRRRTDNGEVIEDQADTAQVTDGDWGDLKELYARVKNAADEGDVLFRSSRYIAQMYCPTEGPTKALPWLRGVLHDCDRIIRNVPDPSQLIVNGAPDPGSDPYAVHSSFYSLYANAILDIGAIVGKEPDLVVEGEPDSLEDYIGAAFDILEKNAAKYETADKHDWAHNYAWMTGLLLLADIKGGDSLESSPTQSASSKTRNIMDWSPAQLVEKAQKHFETCSSLHPSPDSPEPPQEENKGEEVQTALEYPALPAFLSHYAHLVLGVLESIELPEEQTKKAEEIGLILGSAAEKLRAQPNFKGHLLVESDVKKGLALVGRIKAEASTSSLVDDEDLGHPLVVKARIDLRECVNLLQEARALISDTPKTYLVETKTEEINGILKDLWFYIYFITEDEAEREAIEQKASEAGFTLGSDDDGDEEEKDDQASG
ncbi:uncharacterized protein EI90DRAFT_1855240 [Cantharellus anzutake]|uniref:uncharacterized protein n=1 Tax=Cantharellus anzutake TaxID=1750568 RepID=UPI0019066B78|nr:uncharacterized protein EI90DRAFT_1855240 [Cantharellus anzutake]KAF8326989.1 hypothetical protein EI90DRAFT_1855240 [Cantharellus anzutake]